MEFTNTIYVFNCDFVFTEEEFEKLSLKKWKQEIAEIVDNNGHKWKGIISYIGKNHRKDGKVYVETIKMFLLIGQ